MTLPKPPSAAPPPGPLRRPVRPPARAFNLQPTPSPSWPAANPHNVLARNFHERKSRRVPQARLLAWVLQLAYEGLHPNGVSCSVTVASLHASSQSTLRPETNSFYRSS